MSIVQPRGRPIAHTPAATRVTISTNRCMKTFHGHPLAVRPRNDQANSLIGVSK